MTDPSAASLRSTIERAYEAMEKREAKGKKGKPKRETLSHELSRLQDCKRFIALCQREWAEQDRWKRDAVEAGARGDTVKTAPASLVKIWVTEYQTKSSAAASGTEAWFSFPLNYLPYVAALAQAQGEDGLDLREETVRGLLLGGKTFDDSVMDLDSVKSLRGRKAGKMPRPSTLVKIIMKIVAKNLEITPAGVWAKLEQEQCPGTTIEDVDDGTTFWTDAKGVRKETRREDIKGFLYRARKALKRDADAAGRVGI